MKTDSYGKKGEDSAAAFLSGKGYTVIGRRVRSGHLETDIIAKKDGCIVFAEVKTRSEYPEASHSFGRPASAVDAKKRMRLIAAAREYMKKCGGELDGMRMRIDVIEVYIKPNCDKYKVLKIVHMENAVQA